MTDTKFIKMCDKLAEYGLSMGKPDRWERYRNRTIYLMRKHGINVSFDSQYKKNNLKGVHCRLIPRNKKAERYLAMYITYKKLTGK